MSRRTAPRGFTMVEVLTSVAIFGIGVAGVVALQGATSLSNSFGREVTTAHQISQSWVDNLAADSEQWSSESLSPPPETFWLDEGVGQANEWFAPTYSEEAEMGALADAQGHPVDDVPGAIPAFCTQLRLSWLCQPGSGLCGGTENVGNGLLRADVRVFWPRRRPQNQLPAEFCSDDVEPTSADYHIVSTSSAVRQGVSKP